MVDTSNVPRRAMQGSHLPLFHAGNEASQGLHGPPAAGDFSVPAACDSAGP